MGRAAFYATMDSYGGHFIDTDLNCMEGDLVVNKYGGACGGEYCDRIKSKACWKYLKWRCKKKRKGTFWSVAKSGTTKCK